MASSSSNPPTSDPASLGRSHGAAALGGRGVPSGALPVPTASKDRKAWLQAYFSAFDSAFTDAGTSAYFQRGWYDGINNRGNKFGTYISIQAPTYPRLAQFAYNHSYNIGRRSRASTVPDLVRDTGSGSSTRSNSRER